MVLVGGFPGGSVAKNLPTSAGDAGDLGSISGSGKCPGGRNGNPLQYSCLDNPMDYPTSRWVTKLLMTSWTPLLSSQIHENHEWEKVLPMPFMVMAETSYQASQCVLRASIVCFVSISFISVLIITNSLILLTLDFIYSSFSSCFRYKFRLFIWDFSCLLR